MSTNVRARRLTVDHHGYRATLVMPDKTVVRGLLTDTLVGEELTDVEIDHVRHTVANETVVQLERLL